MNECKGEINFQIKITRIKKVYINLLTQYVERDNVEKTVTPARLDFPGGTREETRGETGIQVQGVHGGKPQAAAVGGIGVIVLTLYLLELPYDNTI